MSELHQTAKRAHHEASSFTLYCASSRWLLVQLYFKGPAATQHRRQKLNGTVAGLTHDRRVDRVTMRIVIQGSAFSIASAWFAAVSPVRFEIPARAASRSSKLITNQGETPAQSNRGAHSGEWLS